MLKSDFEITIHLGLENPRLGFVCHRLLAVRPWINSLSQHSPWFIGGNSLDVKFLPFVN